MVEKEKSSSECGECGEPMARVKSGGADDNRQDNAGKAKE